MFNARAFFSNLFIFILSGTLLSAAPIMDIDRYIENPDMVAENQEPPHVPLVPFANTVTALKRDRNQSPWYQSLNGEWIFKLFQNPLQVPDGFFKPGYSTDSWDNITVPGVWQMQGFDHNMYRNIPQALAPYDFPNVPDDTNPTGCYLTTFSVPADWSNRPVYLHFEGVKSASFVWLNGEYVGYDQGGMTPSEYNITPLLKSGENTLALQVMRWSDGSYLEDQDMWRFAGIHRNVYLFATPASHIRDFDVRSELDDNYKDAELTIKADISTTMQNTKLSVRAQLYDQDGTLVKEMTKSDRFESGNSTMTLTSTIKDPLKWSAEKPNLYTLLLVLENQKGETLEVLSNRIGFRKLEIKDGMALVNGVGIDFMGVNRHEHHPRLGRTMSEEMMRKDLEIMKQFNVNAVRTSHYPNSPLWYELCDEYGIYIQDEVNAECHYAENWFPDIPGINTTFMDRFTRMVHRDKNHPCVVMWSTGNECGLGEVHYVMADWIKRFDPDRFIMHQGNWPNGWAPYVDIDGPRYRSPYGFLEAWNERKLPVVSGEYAHAMGNSLGHFDELWEVFRREPRQQGGFIWDWVDQGIYEKLVMTKDASENNIMCALMGRPEIVNGPTGNALSLSGLDDYVEVYRDPALDITGNTLTLVADVYPRKWESSNAFITKGDTAYGLQQIDKDTLEFFIGSRRRHSVKTYLPRDWKFNWHRIAGVYDGARLKLIIDGKVMATSMCSGNIAYNYQPVYIGRNADLHIEQYPGWLSNVIIDNAAVYDVVLTTEEINSQQHSKKPVLLLDFEQQTDKGEFLSYGVSPFCINGVIFSDRSVQPETWQMKKSQAPVKVKEVDKYKRKFEIFNYHNFTNLNELDLQWSLITDNKETGEQIIVQSDVMSIDINPRESKVVTIPYNTEFERTLGNEYRLLISLKTRIDHIWAPKGHEVAFDEFIIQKGSILSRLPGFGEMLTHKQHDGLHIISASNFSVTFDEQTGTMTSYKIGDTELIASGPQLNAYRAPILNEWSPWGEKEMDDWHRVGLDKLQQYVTGFRVDADDNTKIKIVINTLTSAPGHSEGFENTYTYTIAGKGHITLHHQIKSVGDFMNMPWLPKIGLQMCMPAEFDQLVWLGRGPFETYPDRKTGAKTGIYQGSVRDQYVPYMVPQDHGNKTDVRWTTLFNSDKSIGLLISSNELLNLSVTPYDNIDRALYAFQLHESGKTIVNLDYQVTGVGGTPVSTRPAYRVYPTVFEYELTFQPLIR